MVSFKGTIYTLPFLIDYPTVTKESIMSNDDSIHKGDNYQRNKSMIAQDIRLNNKQT